MASKRHTNSTTPTEAAPGQDKPTGTSVNRVILAGRLVAAPELRTIASDKHVTTVRVATNDRARAEFHDVVLWGQLAEFASENLTKGNPVYVEGDLRSRTWQAADGTNPRTVEIVADTLQAPSRRKGASPAA